MRLQGQPFQVLALLLERAGEVVTREELQKELWPSDTFVDFDHSLNTAINKVREALGDSASSPRYVETLARKGYRFTAPLQTETRKAEAIPSPQTASTIQQNTGQSPALHPELEVSVPAYSADRAWGSFCGLCCPAVCAIFRTNLAPHGLPRPAGLRIDFPGTNLTH